MSSGMSSLNHSRQCAVELADSVCCMICFSDSPLYSEECDHIIRIANPGLERSGVVSAGDKGGSEVSDIRTSFGVFLERGQDEVVKGACQLLTRYLAVTQPASSWVLASTLVM